MQYAVTSQNAPWDPLASQAVDISSPTPSEAESVVDITDTQAATKAKTSGVVSPPAAPPPVPLLVYTRVLTNRDDARDPKNRIYGRWAGFDYPRSLRTEAQQDKINADIEKMSKERIAIETDIELEASGGQRVSAARKNKYYALNSRIDKLVKPVPHPGRLWIALPYQVREGRSFESALIGADGRPDQIVIADVRRRMYFNLRCLALAGPVRGCKDGLWLSIYINSTDARIVDIIFDDILFYEGKEADWPESPAALMRYVIGELGRAKGKGVRRTDLIFGKGHHGHGRSPILQVPETDDALAVGWENFEEQLEFIGKAYSHLTEKFGWRKIGAERIAYAPAPMIGVDLSAISLHMGSSYVLKDIQEIMFGHIVASILHGLYWGMEKKADHIGAHIKGKWTQVHRWLVDKQFGRRTIVELPTLAKDPFTEKDVEEFKEDIQGAVAITAGYAASDSKRIKTERDTEKSRKRQAEVAKIVDEKALKAHIAVWNKFKNAYQTEVHSMLVAHVEKMHDKCDEIIEARRAGTVSATVRKGTLSMVDKYKARIEREERAARDEISAYVEDKRDGLFLFEDAMLQEFISEFVYPETLDEKVEYEEGASGPSSSDEPDINDYDIEKAVKTATKKAARKLSKKIEERAAKAEYTEMDPMVAPSAAELERDTEEDEENAIDTAEVELGEFLPLRAGIREEEAGEFEEEESTSLDVEAADQLPTQEQIEPMEALLRMRHMKVCTHCGLKAR